MHDSGRLPADSSIYLRGGGDRRVNWNETLDYSRCRARSYLPWLSRGLWLSFEENMSQPSVHLPHRVIGLHPLEWTRSLGCFAEGSHLLELRGRAVAEARAFKVLRKVQVFRGFPGTHPAR
jgi:hypothetical protein